MQTIHVGGAGPLIFFLDCWLSPGTYIEHYARWTREATIQTLNEFLHFDSFYNHSAVGQGSIVIASPDTSATLQS
jgi:hypothetical protein